MLILFFKAVKNGLFILLIDIYIGIKNKIFHHCIYTAFTKYDELISHLLAFKILVIILSSPH